MNKFVGHRCILANGKITDDIVTHCGCIGYPLIAKVNGNLFQWNNNGNHCRLDGSKWDIIGIYVDTTSPIESPTLEYGKRYISVSGRVSGPLLANFDFKRPFRCPTYSDTYALDGTCSYNTVDEKGLNLVTEYKEELNGFSERTITPPIEELIENYKKIIAAFESLVAKQELIIEKLTALCERSEP